MRPRYSPGVSGCNASTAPARFAFPSVRETAADEMLKHGAQPPKKKSLRNGKGRFRFPADVLAKGDRDFTCTRRSSSAHHRFRNQFLKPLVCGSSSSNRERPMAKKPHTESAVQGGADDGIRTRDLRFTKPLLYQLSYVGVGGANIASQSSMSKPTASGQNERLANFA